MRSLLNQLLKVTILALYLWPGAETQISDAFQSTASFSLDSTPFPSPTPTPMITTQDPVQENLALIIGVPTGFGLAIIGILLCVIWLWCSSYCEMRKAKREQSGATNSTNLAGHAPKGRKGVPMRNNFGSSSGGGGGGDDSYRYGPDQTRFEPEVANTLSNGDPTHFEPDPEPEPSTTHDENEINLDDEPAISTTHNEDNLDDDEFGDDISNVSVTLHVVSPTSPVTSD